MQFLCCCIRLPGDLQMDATKAEHRAATRFLSVNQVLGTDMKKHFDIISRFQVSCHLWLPITATCTSGHCVEEWCHCILSAVFVNCVVICCWRNVLPAACAHSASHVTRTSSWSVHDQKRVQCSLSIFNNDLQSCSLTAIVRLLSRLFSVSSDRATTLEHYTNHANTNLFMLFNLVREW